MWNKLMQIHLYKNPVESFIKTLIWFIAFCGGILTVTSLSEKDVAGGAYLIFSLSLLAEFVPQLMEKSFIVARIIHTLLSLALGVSVVIAFALLFGVRISDCSYAIMRKSIIVVMVFLLIDTIAFLIIPVSGNEERISRGTDLNSEADNKQSEFEERLAGGALGSIQEDITNG